MSVTISFNTHSRTFAHPRDALAFYNEAVEKGIPAAQLHIDNQFGVALSAYDNKIPREIQDLIETVELAHGGNVVPEWRWRNKPNLRYGRATTYWYGRALGGKCHYITVSAGGNIKFVRGIVLHEIAHALCTSDDGHNRRFYRTLFRLLRQYADWETEWLNVQHEWGYKKNSRYWYGEMYSDTSLGQTILSDYVRPQIAARRPTKEELAQEVAERMFSDE